MVFFKNQMDHLDEHDRLEQAVPKNGDPTLFLRGDGEWALPTTGGSVSDATTAAKGIVRLSGDLGGTATYPTVPALADKAPLDSPVLTGTPTAPTPAAGDSSAQIATTEFVQNTAGPTDAAVAGFVSAGGPTEAALNATYVAMAPKPTGVAATDTAVLTDAANSLPATGGVVIMQKGTYALNAPLPVLPGVTWQGVTPTTRQVVTSNPAWLADGAFTYESGTVLSGDGTFAAFEANVIDNDPGSSQPGIDEIPQAGWVGIGFENFTYAIHVGARGVMGLSYATLDQLYFTGCTEWAVALTNFAHISVGTLHAASCKGGFYFASAIQAFTPGNSLFGELYVYMPNDKFAHGIQFHTESWGGSVGSLAHFTCERLQVNRFSTPETDQTATLTSGSTNIAVTDGTQFEPGMIVTFATTGLGFTAGQTYVVTSVAGNTLTVANTNVDANLSASASGTVTIQTRGHASLAFTVGDSSCRHVAYNFLNIDIEGPVGAAIYAEYGVAFWLGIAVAHTTTWQDVVLRGTGSSQINSRASIKTDVDAGSTSTVLFGQRGAATQRSMQGLWQNLTNGTSNLSLISGGLGADGDLQSRAGFIYPRSPIGEAVFARNSSLTIAGSQGGDVICASGTAFTITLPTIISDATPNTSFIGIWFDVINVGSAAVTVATNGTQLFNKVAGFTSKLVPAGSSMKVVAVKDTSGNLFWAAHAVQTLPTS